MLAQTIIEDALSEIRVLKKGYSLDGDESQLGLRLLNRMIRHWSGARNLVVPYRTREELTLPLGVNTFTIGTGGDLNTVRPTEIHLAKLLDGSTEYAIRIESLERYSLETDRTHGGRPDVLYYEPSYPLGVIYFDRQTDKAYTLILHSLKPMNNFADLTTDTEFPEEYESLLVSNLAVRSASHYGKSASQDTKEEARMTLASIMASNQADRVPILTMDTALTGVSRFNFNAGEFDNG